MRIMSKIEIECEALEYLHYCDGVADSVADKEYYHSRTPDEMADQLLELKFAQVNDKCDWTSHECRKYYAIASAALFAAGV